MHDLSEIKTSAFAEDVRRGLSAATKFLSSKYFYDDEGSRLFRQIMELPEYYLTRAEFEIFQAQAREIFAAFTENCGENFDLVELGAGDGSKTAVLIDYFLRQAVDFTYSPVDISQAAVDALTEKFKARFPALSIKPRTIDYFRPLDVLKAETEKPKIILFLGSNVGNFASDLAIEFFRNLRDAAHPTDLLLVGFDLQKDARIILPAYDDAQGVTAAFNLNLLARVNRELGADFRLEKFSHHVRYDELEGAVRSYLVSDERQTIFVRALNQTFDFKEGEPIFTEISQKYTLEMIDDLARESGFQVARNFFDSKNYFADSLWKTL